MSDAMMTEPIKQAVAWIGEARQEMPDKPLAELLDDAAMRFNLGPRDWQFLRRLFDNPASSEKHQA